MMKQFDKEIKRVKFEAFGKVKVKFNSKANKELKALHLKKQSIQINDSTDRDEEVAKIDNEIADTLVVKQRDMFQKELGCMLETKSSRGITAATFQLKEKIVGPKSLSTEAVTLIDPVSGSEVNTALAIRQVSLDYCYNLLSSREPDDKFVDDLAMKKAVHELRMIDSFPYSDFDVLQPELFETTYKRLLKTSKHKYQTLMRAGPSMKPALFNLCSKSGKKRSYQAVGRNLL